MENSSYEEIIKTIAVDIAKTEISYSNDDKDDQNKLIQLRNAIEANKESLDKKINELYDNAVGYANKINGVIPADLKRMIAASVGKEQQSTGNTDISSMTVSVSEIEKMVTLTYIEEENTSNVIVAAAIAEYPEIVPIIIGNAQFDGNTITFNDGSKMKYEVPEDKKYQFNSIEEQIEDAKIEERKYALRELLSSKDDISKEEFLDMIHSDKKDGLGLDAALYVLQGRLDEDTMQDFLNGGKYANLFDATLDSLIDGTAKDINFRDDSFTMGYKLALFSKMINADPSIKNTPEFQKALEKCKAADPKLFEMATKDPNLYEKLVQKTGQTDAQNIAVELGGSTPLSREETLAKFAEISKNIVVESKKAEPKMKRPVIEEEPQKPITEDQKAANLEKTLNNIYAAKGVEGVEKFVNGQLKAGKNKEMILATVSTFVVQNKKEFEHEDGFLGTLYNNMLQNGLQSKDDKITEGLKEFGKAFDINRIVDQSKQSDKDGRDDTPNTTGLFNPENAKVTVDKNALMNSAKGVDEKESDEAER